MLVPLLLATATLKPLAVMVHGAGGGGWEYRYWKSEFEAAGYEVVARDLVPASGGLAKTTLSDYVHQIQKWAKKKPSVLIGASMGGVLVLKAAETLRPHRLVLVCSALLASVRPLREIKPYPSIVRWANGPYEDTVASMPDSDEATRRFAHKRWRDESGAVLNEISQGVVVKKPVCPTLSIIPDSDDTVSPADQAELAEWASGKDIHFAGMSHVGPLLSTRAKEVAGEVLKWLKHTP